MLPKEERLALSEMLLSMVEEDLYGPFDPPDVVEAEWDAELKRRIEEIANGKAEMIAGDQVMDEMKKLYP